MTCVSTIAGSTLARESVGSIDMIHTGRIVYARIIRATVNVCKQKSN